MPSESPPPPTTTPQFSNRRAIQDHFSILQRLEEALKVAEEEAREVKLIMAQIQFLSSYNELVKEDPKDLRPYFCEGMIYSLLERNDEAKEQFDKYRQVDGYLRKPLSR